MTVKEASAAVGMNYDSLAELLRKYPSVREWLSPVRERGAWVYADECLPKFRQLSELHKSGISLASIARAIERLPYEQTQMPSEQLPASSDQMLSVIEQTPGTNEQIALFAHLVREVFPAPPDALLTLKQAHAETGVPYAVLRSLRVQVGGRKMVKRSAVLRWIAEL